jgi:hypothetical protein
METIMKRTIRFHLTRPTQAIRIDPLRGNAADFRNKAALLWLLLLLLVGGGAQAQSIQFTVREIALKNGDSTELGDVFYINTNCKSMLKSTPEVEILDGPPGVTATINAAKVVPRGLSCANPVSGGKLVITAKDVQDYSYTRMVLRIRYKTLVGDRERSENINITLFPPD